MKNSLTWISHLCLCLIASGIFGCESNSSSPQEDPLSSESQAITSSQTVESSSESSSEFSSSSHSESSSSSSHHLESSSSLDLLAIFSSSSSERFSFGTLVDERDGQVYKTIVIADSTRSQTWMAENLNFEYPTDPSSSEPNNYCQSDSAEVCKKYGRLYTWSAAIDSAGIYNHDAKGCGYTATCEMANTVHGICPKGYHLPSIDEYDTLQRITGTFGPYSGQKLKAATNDWEDVGTIYGTYVHTYGSDTYGFGALPTYAPGSHYAAIFWTYSQSSGNPGSHGSALDYAFEIIGYEWPDMSPIATELEYKSKHFSVRCIQDTN